MDQTQVVGEPVADVAAAAPAEDVTNPKSAKMFKGRIARCKKVREELVRGWEESVDYRRGKPFSQDSDDTRVNVNLDWSLTKSKQSQLASTMPQVYLTAKSQAFEGAVPAFGRLLNETLTRAKAGAAVEECSFDAINAAGIGVAMVSYRELFTMVDVPEVEMTPELEAAIAQGLAQPPAMIPTKNVTSRKHSISRFSPSDLLWPVEFTGSDFDDSDLLGKSGKMLWSEAVGTFKLKEEDKETILNARGTTKNLRGDGETNDSEELVVEYDELFYWAYRFDAEEKYFDKINHIVFVEGLTEPVIHGPWEGQRFDEASGKYVGACKFPIRVLTLTYISDDAIPPSDSAIGRPQVLEMIQSRGQIVMNRDRSQPIRWYDVNRVDPMVQDTLMRGEFQAFIPVQGDGSRSIGEVARAAYPREDFEFDNVINRDLERQWQIGANQQGSFATGRRSASEAKIVQGNFQTQIGYERARVGAFITGIAEIVASQLALFGDLSNLSPEDQQAVQGAWDMKSLANEMVYTIRPDSTVLLDATQRIEKLVGVLNLLGQSPFVNAKPIIKEILELSGVDTAQTLVDPPQKGPDAPSIGYSFKGEDLLSPLVVAIMLKAGQMPNPEELEAAKKLLQASFSAIEEIPPPVDPNAPQGPAGPPAGAPQAPTGPAHPEWGLQPKIAKREEDL